jgi:hypothetical protein
MHQYEGQCAGQEDPQEVRWFIAADFRKIVTSVLDLGVQLLQRI